MTDDTSDGDYGPYETDTKGEATKRFAGIGNTAKDIKKIVSRKSNYQYTNKNPRINRNHVRWKGKTGKGRTENRVRKMDIRSGESWDRSISLLSF